MKVLIAENNPVNMKQLSDLLEKDGYKTLKAVNGAQALEMYRQHAPDFVCLDIEMGDVSGYDVCREIRKDNYQIPVLFISSKSNPADKVAGLDLGADDYIVKPYDFSEVSARVRAVTRRCFAKAAPETRDDTFLMGDLKIFPQQLRAERGVAVDILNTATIDLSLRDTKILKFFHDNKGRVLTADELLGYCWGAGAMAESKTVEWHISRLCSRIEKNPKSPAIIKTVPGGYKFE